MIDETLRKIEERIAQNASVPAESRQELEELIRKLKVEIATLSLTDEERARSIAGFADISTHEAMRAQKQPQALKHAVEGLSSTVEGFEKAHPQLVEIVNRISVTLANMGI